MRNVVYVVKDWCGMVFAFEKEEKARERYQKLIKKALDEQGMEVVKDEISTYDNDFSAQTTLRKEWSYWTITLDYVVVE